MSAASCACGCAMRRARRSRDSIPSIARPCAAIRSDMSFSGNGSCRSCAAVRYSLNSFFAMADSTRLSCSPEGGRRSHLVQPLLERHVLETLEKFDSATIANVIELFEIRSRVAGYAGSRVRAMYPQLPPAVGYAVTATFRSGYPAAAGDAYSGMPGLLAAAQAIPAPRIVVFQDTDDSPRAATYGEVMVSAFAAFGFVGLITSGAGRDIEQIRSRNFPCFASGSIVAHGYCRIIDVNVPVIIDGLEVRPGNLLHCDANGIVDVPLAFAAEIARYAQRFVDAEDLVLRYCRGKGVSLEGFEKAADQAKRLIAAIGEQACAIAKSKVQ